MIENIHTLHPVILAVPEHERVLAGPEGVQALRRRAREALAYSAGYSRLRLGILEKGAHGAPLPSDGVHWSLSHKRSYVAALAARRPVGIDIEEIRPVNPALRERIASREEWALAPEMSETLFFRFWTAKEAVLKAVGMGFVGLSHCRIQSIVDQRRMIVSYADTNWNVVHYWETEAHMVALTADPVEVQWHLIN